jgi:hypothetical protein
MVRDLHLLPTLSRFIWLRSLAMKLQTIENLFVHELKDLLSAEKQIVKALPKMATVGKLIEAIQHVQPW